MGDILRVRFPVRLPSRANEQHGGRRRKRGGKLGAKIALPAEQRAATAAALGWWCPRCGEHGRVVPGVARAMVPPCDEHGLAVAGAYRLADPRPPIVAGPEHPVDVLQVRIPSAPRGQLLDSGGNLGQALKAIQDEVTELLWRWNGLPGRSDDSVPWLRWCCEQSTEGRLQGTEQCEVRIAPRGDLVWPTPAVLVRWLRREL